MTSKNKISKNTTIGIHKRVLLICCSACLAIGIVLNLFQYFRAREVSQEIKSESNSLDKYRQLQEQQIQAVRTACENGRKDYDADKSTTYFSYILLKDGYKTEDLAEKYRLDVAYAQCYSSVLVVLGERDIDTITYDRMEKLGSQVMKLDDDIFDSVKW